MKGLIEECNNLLQECIEKFDIEKLEAVIEHHKKMLEIYKIAEDSYGVEIVTMFINDLNELHYLVKNFNAEVI